MCPQSLRLCKYFGVIQPQKLNCYNYFGVIELQKIDAYNYFGVIRPQFFCHGLESKWTNVSPNWQHLPPKPEQFALADVAGDSRLEAFAANKGGKNKEFR